MEAAESEFVGLLQELAGVSGFDRGAAALFAIAYLQPDDVSLEELAEMSGYSLSSVSTKVQTLERLGMVKRARKPHTNRVFVQSERDFGGKTVRAVLEAQRRKFAIIREKMPQIMERYRPRAKSEAQKKKLRLMEDYYAQALRFEKFFEKVIEKHDGFFSNGKV